MLTSFQEWIERVKRMERKEREEERNGRWEERRRRDSCSCDSKSSHSSFCSPFLSSNPNCLFLSFSFSSRHSFYPHQLIREWTSLADPALRYYLRALCPHPPLAAIHDPNLLSIQASCRQRPTIGDQFITHLQVSILDWSSHLQRGLPLISGDIELSIQYQNLDSSGIFPSLPASQPRSLHASGTFRIRE